ncbi:MAG: hypothetical protein V1736_07140 [Pseudomonadota bacterium]
MRMTSTRAVKRYCLSCTGGIREEVRNCTDRTCPFWIHRTGKPRVSVKTIRRFCLECTNSGEEYVRNCPSADCLCYPFRMGRNPNINLTSEQKAERAKRMFQNREMAQGKPAKFESSLTG